MTVFLSRAVSPQLSENQAVLTRKALLRSLALQLMTRATLRLSQCSVRTQVPAFGDVAARKDESLRVLSSPSPCACAGPVRQLFERGHLGDGYPQHRSPPLPGPQSFPRYFAQQELFSLPRHVSPGARLRSCEKISHAPYSKRDGEVFSERASREAPGTRLGRRERRNVYSRDASVGSARIWLSEPPRMHPLPERSYPGAETSGEFQIRAE